MMKQLTVGLGLLLLSGCASYGVIDNAELGNAPPAESYSVKALAGRKGSGDIALTLAFSGGEHGPRRCPMVCWRSCATPL